MIVFKERHYFLNELLNGNYFDQISGAEMGIKIGPFYVNMFMGNLEQKIWADFGVFSPEHLDR